jgi:hypothetical protein
MRDCHRTGTATPSRVCIRARPAHQFSLIWPRAATVVGVVVLSMSGYIESSRTIWGPLMYQGLGGFHGTPERTSKRQKPRGTHQVCGCSRLGPWQRFCNPGDSFVLCVSYVGGFGTPSHAHGLFTLKETFGHIQRKKATWH